MPLSVLDFFTIGIGPSSSHAVGPMRAARRFVDELASNGALDAVTCVKAELFGSLALTGIGHGTDRSVLMGLEGAAPETVDPDAIGRRVAEIAATRTLRLAGRRDVPFDPQADLVFHRRERLPRHTNGLRFTASFSEGRAPFSREYYSIGGGFVIAGDDRGASSAIDDGAIPYPFDSAAKLLQIAAAQGWSISQVALANENALRPEADTRERLMAIWQAMQDCIAKGCCTDGILPGGLNIERRAPVLYRRLASRIDDPLAALDWVNVFALAVNEENAAGSRVVTAPTNGAAGIIPAVLLYYRRFDPAANDEGVVRFLLTAGAIAMLYKRNASISGAEVGCQGEVGVACSMAAAGLAEAQFGTPAQVEQAAEIGMEHNLGLTCDPIKGLVQIPCIERNAMGAVKAINAARLALCGDGKHIVSLDRVIEVMRRTGADMSTKYKETSRGGLAVNVAEC